LTVALGLLAALALVIVPASVHVGSFVAVSLLLGVTLFSIQPLSQATVAYYSPPETRGLSFGYTYLAIFGVGALGAALAGGVLTYGSATLLFVVLAGLAATGSIVSIVLFRVGTRRS
ncbi:MAG: MFS transporter, partial [Natronomonas sp.]